MTKDAWSLRKKRKAAAKRLRLSKDQLRKLKQARRWLNARVHGASLDDTLRFLVNVIPKTLKALNEEGNPK